MLQFTVIFSEFLHNFSDFLQLILIELNVKK